MKERPILFKGEMVRAIQREEDPKTQTRRIVKPQPVFCGGIGEEGDASKWGIHSMDQTPRFIQASELRCPYGQPGDRLWVKETAIIAPKRFAQPDDTCVLDSDGDPRFIQYVASHPDTEAAEWYKLKKTPSIFMPRWASRITLEIAEVRVQRLQDISEEDAIAEGIETELLDMSLSCRNYLRKDAWFNSWGVNSTPDFQYVPIEEIARASYRSLWESINGLGSWEANPWVWAITFRRVQP